MIKIYYLFSSITFLQFYIPLVIEAKKRGYKNVFIIRNNYKNYADPLSDDNLNILLKYVKEYDIKLKLPNKYKISEIKGIVFMIDGDIYGPPRKSALESSLLFKLDPNKTIKFTMTEHMNFWAVYHNFIDSVDHACFTNPNIINQMDNFTNEDIRLKDDTQIYYASKSYKSNKNIFLGNTKFDNIPSKDIIYKKFNLNINSKYCLFLFPKIRDNFNENDILNIYSHLRKLGFKIIVKSRPKDPKINDNLRGDLFVSSDIYPNESLELMKISELCIISSSSANEETIFSKIPCIDIISDLRPWERNQYLLDDNTYIRIENEQWKNMSFDKFKNISYMFIGASPNQTLFNDIIERVIVNINNNIPNKMQHVMDITGPRIIQNIICDDLKIKNYDGCLVGTDESKLLLQGSNHEFIYTKIHLTNGKTDIYKQLQAKYKQRNYQFYNYI